MRLIPTQEGEHVIALSICDAGLGEQQGELFSLLFAIDTLELNRLENRYQAIEIHPSPLHEGYVAAVRVGPFYVRFQVIS